jgi:hypothetical protein
MAKPRFAVWPLVVSLAIAATALFGGASATGATALHPVYRLTLARVDGPCFHYPSPVGAWPVSPTLRSHAIRGGFNDPRSPFAAHFGVDVAADEQANVYAVTAGWVSDPQATAGPDARFTLTPAAGPPGTEFDYWHVRLTVAPNSFVSRGQVIGRIVPLQGHVHLSEWTPTCGYIDPRRPTGILRDPANTERPVISNLRAFVANRAAYAPFGLRAGRGPSTPLGLTDLHGRVDFRAQVSDTPKHATSRWPQQPLMVAGVRSWIAPAGQEMRRIGKPIYAYRGGRFLRPRGFYHVYALGTIRVNECFKRPAGHCFTQLVLHVGGDGVHTRRLANGAYQFCVSAVTIRNMSHHRCWPITVNNN